jgi:hypothetical protein
VPRVVSETWKTITASEITHFSLQRSDGNVLEAVALYVIRRQSDNAIVKRGRAVIPLSGAQQTSIVTFITTNVVPVVNVLEGTT